MSLFADSALFWLFWLALWAAVMAILFVFIDPAGYRGRHVKPSPAVAAAASVAAVISGWQPRISRIP